jgi:hypothetical protein
MMNYNKHQYLTLEQPHFLHWPPALFIALLTIWLLAPHPALANQCMRQWDRPLEVNFIESDTVFSGIAGDQLPSERSPVVVVGEFRVPFQITDVYKSPSAAISAHTQVTVASDVPFIPGQKYIVLGSANPAKPLEVNTSSCLKTTIEPNSLTALIKQWDGMPEKLKSFTHNPQVLVFTGHVEKVELSGADQKAPISASPSFKPVRDYGRATLDVFEILANTTSEPSPKPGFHVTVLADTPCAGDFRVGQDYLVLALPDTGPSPDNTVPSGENYWVAGCHNAYLLSEEDLLRKWSTHSF